MPVNYLKPNIVIVAVQNPEREPVVTCDPDRLILVGEPDDVTILFKLVTPQFVFPENPEEAIEIEKNDRTFYDFCRENATEISVKDRNLKGAKIKDFKYIARVLSNKGDCYQVDPLIINK